MNAIQNSDGPGGVPAAQERFIERMGQLFEEDGFARIAGRTVGYLMLQAEPQSLDGLAAALKVSKASVSNNTRLLEGLGVLERVTHAGDRRDYYVIADFLHERMLELRLKRFEATRTLLEEAVRSGAAPDEHVRERMESLGRFFEALTTAIRTAQKSWQKVHGETRS